MERLVVEADREEARETVEDAKPIGFDTAHRVDRRERHALLQRLDVGAEVEALAGLHQRVHVVIGEREQSSRPVVLEAAPENVDAGRP